MNLVAEFHRAFRLAAPTQVEIPPAAALLRLRMRLITEEYKEVMHEMENLLRYTYPPDDVINSYRRLLKELCDLRYVVEGCAVSLGLPFDAAYEEVHRSNMSKLDDQGLPLLRGDGKVLKGPHFRGADMEQFIPSIITQEVEDE